MTAVGWHEDGWDDDQPTVPAYRCEGLCCQPDPAHSPGLLARILAIAEALRGDQPR